MTDVGNFPTLPGLAWSVTKSPTFQTRIQRAVSGRELRALDYPYPLWQFALTFDFLRDNPSAGFTELRKLMGFYMLCQGAFGTFLFNDPTDNQVFGQPLPNPFSSGVSIAIAPGSGYALGNILIPSGGLSSRPMQIIVSGVDGGGGITSGYIADGGSYAIVPGVTGIPLTGGSGSGATVNVTWVTSVQMVRTFGDSSLPGGGFTDFVTAPTFMSALYFNGVSQNLAAPGWAVNVNNGLITIPTPFYPFLVNAFLVVTPGTHYITGDIITAAGGVGTPAQWQVIDTVAAGGLGPLRLIATGSYTTIPGGTVSVTGGTGSGGQIQIGYLQIPIITADFTYAFRCRFIDDGYSFENFMLNLWQLKKLSFISIRS